MMRALLLFLSVLVVPLPSWAGAPFAELASAGRARVASTVDGDTVVLADGRQVRLTGIQAPKLPLGRIGFVAWPLAEDARAVMAELADGRDFDLHTGGAGMDRHGRLLAHMARAEDGLWLQGEMLSRGLARVYTFPDNRALAAEMLAREAEARTAKRGIWGLPFYAVRAATATQTLLAEVDTYQLVEGTVASAAKVGKRVYVNFGDDYRTDMTVSVPAAAWPLFEAAGWRLDTLPGQRVRARGWLSSRNGPMIEMDHPERLELLGP